MSQSSNRILYHASTIEIESPLTNVGRKDLDFGPGFYVKKDSSANPMREDILILILWNGWILSPKAAREGDHGLSMIGLKVELPTIRSFPQ